MDAGTNSYVLFTLDKLIAKVMKAFQGLMQDPLACKLFDMYKYECSRSVPFADAVYHANTHVVLHEDHCFRLQSQPDGQLNVQLLDPDKTEVTASEYQSTTLSPKNYDHSGYVHWHKRAFSY